MSKIKNTVNTHSSCSETDKVRQLCLEYEKYKSAPFGNPKAKETYRQWYCGVALLIEHYYSPQAFAPQAFASVIKPGSSVVASSYASSYDKFKSTLDIYLDQIDHGKYKKRDLYRTKEKNSENISKETMGKGCKVFISHSSDDKKLIKCFIEKIMRLGIGLEQDDIAYTSAEEYGAQLGENIPEYIKKNLKEAEVVLLMISDNYKKSEICLNEMGAAWILENKCYSILLPNTNFDEIGWLKKFEKAVHIDEEGLDSLYEKICDDLGKKMNIGNWNNQKKEFLHLVNKNGQILMF